MNLKNNAGKVVQVGRLKEETPTQEQSGAENIRNMRESHINYINNIKFQKLIKESSVCSL